ncbi:hypothetical protein ACHWQZ_G009509 [Mnemiopsis leidyi]
MNTSDIISQIWCHVSFILGLVGNIFVLFSTTSHRAIKLDKLSVWIIQNLAVSDIGNTVLILVPVITSFYANKTWILGDTFCEIMFLYKYIFTVANVILINALSLNKMMRCLFPLRILNSSRGQRVAVSVFTMVGSLILPVWSYYGVYVGHFLVVEFSPSQSMCWSVFAEDAENWQESVGYVLAGMLNGMPCLVLCVVNSFLVGYALKKSNTSVNKMNIVIVVMVTVSFLLPMLPYYVYYMVAGGTWDSYPGTVRFVTFIMFISLWANPPIYILTNRSFRIFTTRLFRGNAVHNFSDSKTGTLKRNNMRYSDVVELRQAFSPEVIHSIPRALSRVKRNSASQSKSS